MRRCLAGLPSKAGAAGSGLVLLLSAWPGLAPAEKADRGKPMVVEASGRTPSTIDAQNNVVVFTGSVVISQGTLTLRAERVELREAADGQRVAVATGTAQGPATYRQKGDSGNEWVEGRADRIDYDTRSDTLRFTGAAHLRRLRDGEVVDEMSGAAVSWDNKVRLFSLSGGGSTPANPAGRVRAVFSPRPDSPASAASARAVEPLPLQPSRTLGDKP